MWHHKFAMNFHRTTSSIVPYALAALLLAGGCKKQNSSESAPVPEAAPATAPVQTSAPAPPPDETAGVPAVSPSSETAAAPPPSAPAATAGTAPAPTTAMGPAAAPALVIPAGSHIVVTVQQDLGSNISQAGEAFSARVARPIVIRGQTVIRAGAQASGTVIDARPLGRLKGEAVLALRLDSVRTADGTYQIRSSTLERVESGKGKRSAGFIGGGAGLGAIIGGLAGGGKGALIGGLAGAGAGTAGAGLTGKKNILIPAETPLTFRIVRAVVVQR
jgi:hypothetical protein